MAKAKVPSISLFFDGCNKCGRPPAATADQEQVDIIPPLPPPS